METHDRVWVTVWMFLYGTLGISLVALPDWLHFQAPTFSSSLLWAMAFSILGGTILTYFLNFWALAYARSSSVALFIYLQPIFAALLAWYAQGETPTPRTLLAGFMIFAGMLLAITLPAPPEAKKA
jgi:drug/metabolite transporter (DMT)-like permease